jgi:DNA-directed RNA polymerase subunit N (RpoN/RPB10)
MMDEQVVKALERCGSDEHRFACEKCPRLHNGIENERYCRRDLIISAYDLIKRKQEEIEALINGQETLQKMCAEAYKRFAERVKDKACLMPIDDTNYAYVICGVEIDDLVKELTEGSDDTRRMD